MRKLPPAVLIGAGAFALLSAAAVLGPSALAMQLPNPPLVYKSVSGKIEVIDTSLNGIILRADSGERLAWKFSPRVVQQASGYKPGDPMWVIYRQLSPSERAVTALGFPGTDPKTIYVNATGRRVLLRTGPATDGKCEGSDPANVADLPMPSGRSTVNPGACWCCASSDQTCAPVNHSGAGRIVLTQCFP
jgi:hypothetical protein